MSSRGFKRRREETVRQRTLEQLPLRWAQNNPHDEATARKPQLRQASITDLKGVVNWRAEGESHTELASVPPTLYLGHEDVVKLRELLERDVNDHATIMATLRRLAAMPCTHSLLASTKIGVAVGRLRKHPDAEIAELSTSIVKVWKAQLGEHRKQTGSKDGARRL